MPLPFWELFCFGLILLIHIFILELTQLINDCKQELNNINNITQNLSVSDPTRKYLTYYALIKASGTAEYVYRSMIADHFQVYNSQQIDTYLDKCIRNGQHSAKYENMKKLLGQFDDNWRSKFQSDVNNHFDASTNCLDGQKLITSSNSLVTNRHAFAHGKNPTVGLNDIIGYFDDTIVLISIMDNII